MISIGIPVFNQEHTIRDTIQSVLEQSDSPDEIIVSENHSTDGTLSILREFGEKIRIVRPERHLSMAENWNYCTNQCKAEWVALISGDDLARSNYVKDLKRGIKLSDTAVFVMGGWENKNQITGVVIPHPLLSMKQITKPPKTIKMVLESPKASFAAFAFKKSTFTKIGGYNTSFNLIQDWMFQVQMAPYGSFVKIDSIIAIYRLQERSELEGKRVPLYVADYLLYLETILWSAVDNGVQMSEVRHSGQIVFTRLLSFMTEKKFSLSPELNERTTIVADKLGMNTEFQLFLTGHFIVKTNPLFSFLKSTLRGFYMKFIISSAK